MQRKRKNVTEIFASGGSIKTGKAGGGYWNNEPPAHTWESAGGETGDSGGVNAGLKTAKSVSGLKVANAVAAAAPLVQMGIDLIDTGEHTGGRKSVGGQTASMAVQGAALGTSIVPGWGTLIGGVVGAGYGLYKGSRDNRKAKREIESESWRRQSEYATNDLQPNFEMYGNRYEDGGLTGAEDIPHEEVQQAQLPAPPQKKMINIEKDEIMINPMDMTIVQKFTNPNRFASHKKNQFMEPHGNFVALPEGHVIVPKKLAKRFEKGDVLTRKSIVMDLLTKQANNPYHNTPEEAIPEGAEQFAGGGLTDYPLKPIRPKNAGKLKVKITQPIQENATANGFVGPVGGGFYNYNTHGQPIGPQNITTKTDMGGTSHLQIPLTNVPRVPLLGLNDSPKGILNLSPEVKNSIDEENKIKFENFTNVIDQPRGNRRKFNIGKAGRVIAQNAPILAQMLTNGQGDAYLGANPNVNYNDAISLAGQLPEDISIAGTLAANDRSFLVASKAIDNNDTPAARAEKSQLLAEKFAGDNAAYQGREVTRAQLRSTKLQTLLGLKEKQGADWQQDRRYLSTEQRMDAAARDNNQSAALVNLGENVMQAQNDDERIKLINLMTHSVDIDPLAQELIKEDPGFTSYIFNYMSSGKGDYLQARNEYLTNRANKFKTTTYDKTVANSKDVTRTVGTKKEVNR